MGHPEFVVARSSGQVGEELLAGVKGHNPRSFSVPFHDRLAVHKGETALYIRITTFEDLRYHLGRDVPCLLYTSPSPRDRQKYRMPSSA